MDFLNLKLHVNFKNGLNLENSITNESVECRPLFPVYWDQARIQGGVQGADDQDY